MLDRRAFCLSTTALALTAGGAAAAAPSPAGDARLNALFDRFFQTALDESPMLATSLGLDTGARADAKARLDDNSLAALARHKAITAQQVASLGAVDRAGLSTMAAINRDSVLYALTLSDEANRRFAYGGEGGGAPYVVSQINGAYQGVPDFLDTQHTIATKADCEAYLSRLAAFATAIDRDGERVRHDAALGVTPPDFAIDGALRQSTTLRAPADQSTLVTSLRPKARHDAGVWRLPDGDAYYANALKASITTDATPDDVHRMGLDVTRDLTARADTLFARLGLTKGTVAQRYAQLFKDPKYLYPNDDAGKAREIADLNALVQAMQAKLPAWFGTLPKTPLEIRRIPKATEAGASTHYTEGSLDGSRPGIYWLNLRDTAEAPFWDMPTTTFHEGLPGHHLQLTLQRQSDLPLIRKIGGFNAYAEGWALYAEQLADEMGFYKDQPAWALGYIHDALLRSGRLVVDTGIHHLRWSREKAVSTLSGIDGDPESLSGQEIERYACTPGQACSYMVGKIFILRLRDKARAALGDRFDIRRFHDAVLLAGSMPLTVLEARVDAYIAAAT